MDSQKNFLYETTQMYIESCFQHNGKINLELNNIWFNSQYENE